MVAKDINSNFTVFWTPERVKELLKGSLEDAYAAFPDHKKSTIQRKRRQFRGRLEESTSPKRPKVRKHKDTSKDCLPIHVVIPDTQVKPGVPTDHLEWAGQYIVDKYYGRPNVKVIHLGDHWDMPSLSSYDKGTKSMEGRRVMEDIQAGNEAFKLLNAPLEKANEGRIKKWLPERHFIAGNDEQRLTRAIELDAQLDGILSLDMFDTCGWEWHDFLKPVFIDGVGYAHYWANPMTGKPYGGMALTRLKTIGHSFSQGHQQTLDYALRFVQTDKGNVSQHALIAGAFYQHSEIYKGYQGNAHWRGIVVKHAVVDGSYDPMFVRLDYLRQRYGDKT